MPMYMCITYSVSTSSFKLPSVSTCVSKCSLGSCQVYIYSLQPCCKHVPINKILFLSLLFCFFSQLLLYAENMFYHMSQLAEDRDNCVGVSAVCVTLRIKDFEDFH